MEASAPEYREELKKSYAGMEEPADWGGEEVVELWEAKWAKHFVGLLKAEGKTARDIRRIAQELRATSTTTNGWIAKSLAMGHPSRVCNLIHEKTFKL